ncbi:APH(3'') family aminoglycoside O-phosphotransferase [Mycolicibacterium conceptionense]|uniref:APH(3'') family aminoglycoside O-phosphotransferase n=1 Tax=Mycolicibacterium conceptionense TaxID=451644 RepID=A0A1A2VGT0_9MYCO|nr:MULTISPECIES: APH(3'') family aminoglycoside O-phosphotransferase [Mycolicibacterium]MCW1820326.1 APH(3'') family aminoglycoside O-phosphotransferase [Mycolicibacterium senegalense]OBB09787.1 APH(3'') family aminoglycoside O-phosphotransferase [Mycolicibacterium conceptionense]OBE97008.1 APH(3'') family aminoglycoside O-phosphotransferase [Mycolicibacterium conceptionense]OBF15290.1 APH(3'') family aminoglycoside O-phosphotransferase [Mycolicibacterium conceptionense]OBF34753.1 APH(3'') fam
MTAWLPVTGGESGASVFRSADGSRYAKVVGAAGVADLAAERDRVAWAGEQGLPVPAVIDWHTTADGGARLITSAVAGVAADSLPEAALRAAWPGIVAALAALHGLAPTSCPFSRELDVMLSRARAVVAADAVNPEFLSDDDRGVAATELLARIEREAELRRRQEPADRVVCHGDLCLPNIMVDPEGCTVEGFIDLGRLGVADRHADLALLLANTAETFPGFAADAAAGVAAGYPAEVDEQRLRFYLGLDPLTWG